ncbi:related to zinc finger protein [Cephalotrichum gorgonifer]|uniref:Related to zinc finger protein n=1 Tax=Cephalotrichum gorgonifer TaxID=2041049 RepID=A0AAE8N2K2_9PEZI|nr:related to zinc finger protein [Cephalotrichum gorgonifer]
MRFDRDEGYASLSSTRSTKESLPTGFGAYHNRFQTSADDFCDSMKNKLNPLRTFDNKSPTSAFPSSPSTRDYPPNRLSPESRLPPLSGPVSLPLRTAILEEPERFTQTPLNSAVSPRLGPFSLQSRAPRSPGDNSDVEFSLRRRLSGRTNSSIADDYAASPRGPSDDGREDTESAETSSMRRLRIDDQSREFHVAGLKRRASSPPGDEPMLHLMASQGDLRRRELSRGSPTPRLGVLPKGSGSSVSSSNGHSGSFTSTFSVAAPSTATSVNSFGRRSPVGRSLGSAPTSVPDQGPYTTINVSPRGSMTRPHQRRISETLPTAPPRKVGEPAKGSGQRMQGFILMCECCPKKPKKFETVEELRAHEAEKQYECSFCGNRFKNKNEAERHQNSLHVRRHSWSCKALELYSQAFHESTNRPGEADTCGYCGRDFNRTGPVATSGAGHTASDQDWDERIQHLTTDHKFRECNSSKKFFRADHFRQHLKHSHAGSSGKWTNMLENACMIEEGPLGK